MDYACVGGRFVNNVGVSAHPYNNITMVTTTSPDKSLRWSATEY